MTIKAQRTLPNTAAFYYLCHKFLIRETTVVLPSATNDRTEYCNITMRFEYVKNKGEEIKIGWIEMTWLGGKG